MNDLDNFLNIFQYAFARRAMIVGICTAVSCSILGVFLVPRRFSMIGDGLAHFGFAAVGLSLILRMHPMAAVAPLLVLAAMGILELPRRAALFGDAAIGMIAVVGLAVGVMFASLSRGLNVDLFGYLFGDILTVTAPELYVSVGLTLTVIIAVLLWFNDLTAVTFDSEHARVLGLRPERLDRLLAVLTALTVTVAIKVAGTLLLSSLLIFPAAAALQVARGFRAAVIISIGVGVSSVVLGILAAFLLDWPAGATITLINAVIFVVLWIISRRAG